MQFLYGVHCNRLSSALLLLVTQMDVVFLKVEKKETKKDFNFWLRSVLSAISTRQSEGLVQ